MRFTEIGQQLRAYRLESGLRAEEIAARLGVSRAALYRYEKGEVIKLDTVKRLAELLKISPLSLLGIGVEYYNRPVGYFERVRQTEESADQVLQVFGPLCYLTTSDAYDAAMADAYDDLIAASEGDKAGLRAGSRAGAGHPGSAQAHVRHAPARHHRHPVAARIERLLEAGIAGSIPLPDALRQRCRQVAAAEVEQIATMMEAEPMGLQFGVLPTAEPTSSFKILRARDRATLAINPFRPTACPAIHTGVAMITGADEAVATHQRVAEQMWRDSLKGAAGAAQIRRMMQASARRPGDRPDPAAWPPGRRAATTAMTTPATCSSTRARPYGAAAPSSTSCASATAASTAACPACGPGRSGCAATRSACCPTIPSPTSS